MEADSLICLYKIEDWVESTISEVDKRDLLVHLIGTTRHKINAAIYFLNMMKVEEIELQSRKLKNFQKFHFFLDAFLFELRSCFDVLGHMVNIIYNTNLIFSRVSFFRVRERLNKINLKTLWESLGDGKSMNTWFGKFNQYRISITHYIILQKILLVERDGIIKVMLPDNPSDSPKIWASHHSETALEFCDHSIEKTVDFINKTFDIMLQDTI